MELYKITSNDIKCNLINLNQMEGHAAALHPALEATALCGVLRHPKETERIPVLHSRPSPATGDVHRC